MRNAALREIDDAAAQKRHAWAIKVRTGSCAGRTPVAHVILAKVANKETASVVWALIKQARKLPHELYRSLTWDRGAELADHRRFTPAINDDRPKETLMYQTPPEKLAESVAAIG